MPGPAPVRGPVSVLAARPGPAGGCGSASASVPHRTYLARVCAFDSVVAGGALDIALARLCADDCRAMEELGNAMLVCLAGQSCGDGPGGGRRSEDTSQSMVV
jgi:hypothetical protein